MTSHVATTGPLALVGGTEHSPGCEPIDRHLLEATGAHRPVVAVVPFASSLRTRARTVGRAVEWWTSLGAVPLVVAPEAEAASAIVADADLTVMTGGVPDRLQARLVGTPLWSQLVARWRAGGALAGSSSGAMVLGDARQSVRPPFRIEAGAGLLPGVAIAPHHQLLVPRRVAAWRARTHPHLAIVGIDDRTALVGDPSRELRVVGVGEVTVRRGTWVQRYPAGAVLAPEELGLLPTAVARRAVPTERVADVRTPGPADLAPQRQAVPA